MMVGWGKCWSSMFICQQRQKCYVDNLTKEVKECKILWGKSLSSLITRQVLQSSQLVKGMMVGWGKC
jgi:hypothetical protein